MNNRPDLLHDVTGKLRAKRRRTTWLRVRWYVAGAVALVVLSAAVWLIWFSEVLVARNVVVVGTQQLTSEEVTEAAKVPFGVQLARLDLAQIGARVGELPGVAAARASSSWPGTVTITVTERIALYQRHEANTYAWVDASGAMFHHGAQPAAGLPIAVTATTDARLLRDVATVVASLSPQLKERLVQVNATTPDTINLRLTNDATLVWGSADRSDLKSQVATALLKVEAKTYDVSAPENPMTRR